MGCRFGASGGCSRSAGFLAKASQIPGFEAKVQARTDGRTKDFAYSPKFLQLFHEDFGYESCHHSTPGMEIFSPELETSLFRLDFQLPVDIVGLRG
jgi:hypothetical protein